LERVDKIPVAPALPFILPALVLGKDLKKKAVKVDIHKQIAEAEEENDDFDELFR
jgi:hypothetical protein